jgi:signal transduction histidine kinase/CheY-like chemotaxis protein
MFQFLYVALQAKHSPFWRVFLLGSSFLFAFTIGLAYVGGLYEAILISNNTIFIYILLYPLLILMRLKHRQRHSEAFLVAAMIFFILISHRVLYILGVLNEPLHAHGLIWSLLLVGLALSLLVGFATRSVALYREQIQHQNQLIEYQKQAQTALEKAVERRTRELQQAIINADEANRAKSDFLARVSHDLKSPLTSILGYSELICAQEAPTAAEKSQIIYRSAQRLLNLVNDLIEYATGDKHPDKLHNRPVYSASFFNSIAEEAQLLANLNHNQFNYSLHGALPGLIEVDSKRLHQILINLLSNACKFTQQGQIHFTIDVQPLDTDHAQLLFHIRDNGCGIEPSQLDIIFQPFKRLAHHRAIEGLGLGLAIAKHWADQMGAQLQAHSQLNQGTEMILRLTVPIVAERALDSAQLFIDNPAMPELNGDGRHLWLIEDTPAILTLLTTQLESLGFTVSAMTDAETALDAISRPANTQPDLIITDYHLPNKNGQAILDAARQRWPNQRAILISAAYDSAQQDQQTQAFDALLSKPIELAKLRQTLIQLLQTDNTAAKPAPTLAQQIKSALSKTEWHKLKNMIECYAVSDIIDWSERYQSQHPHHTPWLQTLRQRARDAQLAPLQELIKDDAP